MNHRIVLYICIIAIIFIGFVLVYGNYQNNLANKQGQVKGTKTEKDKPTLGLFPSSGPVSTNFTISGSGFHANSNLVTVTWNNDNLEVSSNSTDSEGNFFASAKVPIDAKTKKYTVEVSTTGLAQNYQKEPTEKFNLLNLLITKTFAKYNSSTITAQAIFTVTETEETPDTTISTSSETPSATSTSTTISTPATTSTSSISTSSSSENVTSVSSTTSVTTSTRTTPTTTSNQEDGVTAVPEISSSPSASNSVTTSANPRVSVRPIIIDNEQTDSSVYMDKNKVQANGEDKITVTIDSQNNNTLPEIEVSGEQNTISEIKKEDGKFVATISSTKPEIKNISVKFQGQEIANANINFTDTNISNNKNTFSQTAPFYKSWVFWLIMGLIFIVFGFSLLLYYKNKKII